MIILAVYVDDVVIAYAGSEAAMKAGFMAELQRAFDIKNIGPISFCLGVRVQRDEQSGSITLSMPAYIEDLLEKLRLSSISAQRRRWCLVKSFRLMIARSKVYKVTTVRSSVRLCILLVCAAPT